MITWNTCIIFIFIMIQSFVNLKKCICRFSLGALVHIWPYIRFILRVTQPVQIFFFRVKISSPFLVHHVGKSTIYNLCSFRKNILPNLISLSWWYIQHIFKVSHAQFWHLWKFIRSEFFSIASLNWSKRS